MKNDTLNILKLIIIIVASLLLFNILTTFGNAIEELDFISNITIELIEVVIFSAIILALYFKLKKSYI